MPKLRRRFWSVFLFLLIPLALAGCGKGGPSDDAEDEGGNEDAETETVTGDLSLPNSGMFAAWPLATVKGAWGKEPES